jgi:hypothetical protein
MAEKQTRRGSDEISLDGGRLGTLHFSWRDDRYRHSWQFDNTLVIESIEGDSAANWPLSPPIQQIHQQEFPDGRQVVFGVGMAGRGHWSVSYTLVPDLKCWIIEHAFRSPVEADSLAATYELAGDWKASDCTQVGALNTGQVLSLDDCGGLTLEAIPPAQLKLLESTASIRSAPPATVGTTAQWSFRLRVK